MSSTSDQVSGYDRDPRRADPARNREGPGRLRSAAGGPVRHVHPAHPGRPAARPGETTGGSGSPGGAVEAGRWPEPAAPALAHLDLDDPVARGADRAALRGDHRRCRTLRAASLHPVGTAAPTWRSATRCETGHLLPCPPGLPLHAGFLSIMSVQRSPALTRFRCQQPQLPLRRRRSRPAPLAQCRPNKSPNRSSRRID